MKGSAILAVVSAITVVLGVVLGAVNNVTIKRRVVVSVLKEPRKKSKTFKNYERIGTGHGNCRN